MPGPREAPRNLIEGGGRCCPSPALPCFSWSSRSWRATSPMPSPPRAGLAGGWLTRYGPPASLVLLYVEESGVPIVIPGDVYIAYLGKLATGSAPKLVASWLGIIAVVLAGSSNLYWISRLWGRRLLGQPRVSALLRLDADRLVQAEGWLRRWGVLAIIFGRHVPGLRIPITVVAGTLKVPYTTFLPS